MLSTALQVGIPGAQELLVIIMIFGMIAVPVVAIALVIKFLTGNDSTTDERVEELEREVEELREERGTATGEPDE